MPNKRDEAADDSPTDLPCLEKLDSPTGMELYYSSYCFQARSETISNWNIITVTILIICGCVCVLSGVREPTHCLIIQSDGAGKLCLQPEPRTWDSGEQRVLLQTQELSLRQARKKKCSITIKATLAVLFPKINWQFSVFWAVFPTIFPSVAWRAEWRRLFTERFGKVYKSSWTVILQTTTMLSFCCRRSKQ